MKFYKIISGKPVIPIILDDSKWPPEGNLMSFRHDFDRFVRNKLDFSESNPRCEELVEKIAACWREVVSFRIDCRIAYINIDCNAYHM